ncbi:MAG: rane fusion protein multidrug efflux system [Phycisphaerales bacterium]|nr:rane fusion protein multidrug efflux system [Phycisphaerales bacterium]
MKTSAWIILLIVVAVAAGFGGFYFGRGHEAGHEEEPAATTEPSEPEPVASVVVAPLKRATITQTITAYGTVIAQPGDVRVLSVPFESRVIRLLVTAGEQVVAGQELVRVGPSPDALVALEEAKNAAAAAQRDLKLAEQRFAEHLATNTELSQAQVAAQSAALKLQSLEQRGVGAEQVLKADAPAIVNKIDAQEGQIVAAGAGLVQLASGNHIEASLGVEPDDAAKLKPKQSVKLTALGGALAGGAAEIEGTIRLIGRRVDAQTRLVPVFVTLPPQTPLLLDSFVAGRLTRDEAEALVVPRDAVLPAEDGSYTLFTIDGEHAKKHTVHVGLENDRDTQVIADDLKEGDSIVVRGNYTLEDGMEVKVESTPETTTQPAATAPTPTPTTREGAP